MTIQELKRETVRINRRIYGILTGYEKKTGVRVREVEIRRSRFTTIGKMRQVEDIEFVGLKIEIDTHENSKG